jgi:aminoglycoside phosphotransferase (APT) family kinase protein
MCNDFMNIKRLPVQHLARGSYEVDKINKPGDTVPIVKRRYLRVALCLVLALLCPLTAYGSPPALIQQYDEGAVRTVLVDEVPDLTINTITLISAGWDNLVADINGEWIFRFPRVEASIQTLEREQLLLERLQNSVSMPVPHYEYIGLHTAFVGYRKIPGGALNEKLYLGCTIECRQEIAESLALFLSQFHRAVSVEEALQWGYKQYHIPLQWIEHNLFGTLPSSEIERIIDEALAYAKQNPCSTKNLVLLHNDLHGGNLAFDIKTKQVTGVFDFSDAAIGDYSVEFGKLFSIHQDLAIRTSEVYASLNDVADPTIPAAVDYILRRALYILYTRECGDVSRESSLVQMLQCFVPIWDGLKNRDKE